VAIAEPAPKTPPVLPEAAPATTAPRPAAPAVTLAPDEIAMLLKRGKDLLTNGDISSARLLLRRAAEAGNAEAALALGSTFDPAVIARLGAIGVEADAAKAREWYEKAAALGSNRASQQIANLAETGR
jgi:TPR repeat protein